MRKCWRCKVEKPLTEYYKGQYGCKACCLILHKRWVKANPKRAGELKARDIERLKAKVRDLYGSKCARCGFDNVRALQVDHINGGGLQEKRRIGTPGIYRRVLRFPLEYQLLCANCNILKLYNDNEHLRRHNVASST